MYKLLVVVDHYNSRWLEAAIVRKNIKSLEAMFYTHGLQDVVGTNKCQPLSCHCILSLDNHPCSDFVEKGA